MSKCQRCGDNIPPQAIMCPRCGAPVTDQRWGQSPIGSASGFGQGSSGVDAGAWQSPQPAQSPQFSVSDLINDDNLPEWMRQGPDAASAGGWSPASAQRTPQSPPAAPLRPAEPGWGAPPPGAWQGAPLESMQTVRQPAVGPLGAGPMNPVAPQGYPSAGWGQGSQVPSAQAPQAPYDQQRYGPSPAAPGYPPTPAYPPNPGYPPMPAYPATPGYPGYPNGEQPAQPGYAPYAQGAYQQSPVPPPPLPAQQPMPAQPAYMPPSAFPPVEQAGMYAATPQQVGMGARGLVDQTALPPWLAGAAPQGQPQGQSLGMQARSLVDEQALPEWLRQQPEERPRPTVAGWLGASASEEPLPAWVTPAFPDAASGRGQPGAAPATPAPLNGYAPQRPAPSEMNPWQMQAQAYDVVAPPVSEDLALPDWLQAQASAAGSMGAGQGATPSSYSPSPYSQHQWSEEPAYEAPPQAAQDIHSGPVDAAPTSRTPNAPKWDLEPLSSDINMGGERDWNAPDGWDDDQPAASEDAWGERGERSRRAVTRGAPLAPDEMPPWLRQGPEYGASAAQGRMKYAEDAAPRRAAGRDSVGWGDEQGWDEGTGAWDNQRGGFDAQDDAGWEREYGATSGRSPRDEWGDASRAPDPYAGRYTREDAGWEQRAPSSPGYGASADFRGSPQRGYDAREPRDPYMGAEYAGADYADYNGATGGYDDADDGHERKRKGWRDFFRRGE